jgi:VIT1/CCC1 family predicted Fe2+/Mn2+ transporter
MKTRRHREHHRTERIGWLRAAVLGSNDAIVSVSSIMMGVGATEASTRAMLVAGVAGLVAGAMSMAVGEYVSVSSQRDAERADIARESEELASAPDAELQELAGIYHRRGLDKPLAMRVAEQLTAHDQLGAHLRDELGIQETTRARPAAAGLDRDRDARQPRRARRPRRSHRRCIHQPRRPARHRGRSTRDGGHFGDRPPARRRGRVVA